MALKKYKPTTPGRRASSVVDTSYLTKKRPEKKLIFRVKKTGGRNSQGKITVRHRGGGEKRFYRMVDFLQNRYDDAASVIALEYDPNRSAHIALIEFPDKERRYILAPQGLQVGDTVTSAKEKTAIQTGNRMPIEFIPTGLFLHNIELKPGAGGKLVRSAGMQASLMAIDGDYAQIKMPSGEVRKFSKKVHASIGQIGNVDHGNVRIGKAGRVRRMGFRPSVRGKAMNPVDHPHGGGEGNQPIGLKHPKTPWGKPALGVRTRRRKASDALILQRRKTKKR
ncbi:MAG: 50S ribosomal protein L2 [Candidatus Nomurabacteria bacterium]|nr:MAG: 50S ribosomal protein L2 [Candidatus Nomurabacteria bacterium]